MNISDRQMDLASLFSRIEQLEAEQNLCKQKVIWLKRYIDEFRKEFNTRPKLQQIESWQQAIAQLSALVAELQQRLNHSPTLSNGLNNGVTTDAQTESANLDDAEVVKHFFEPVEQQQSSCALVDALTIPVHVDTAETDQNQEINVVAQQKPRVTALNDEEFKVERMLLLLDRIYKAEEDSQETPITAEEFWRLYQAGEKNFNGINLAGVNMSRTTLASGVNLSKANLSDTNLTNVNWSNVNLSGANLRGADISEADLSAANLSEANLDDTYLYKTKLKSGKLEKATLKKANLKQTDLNGSNLRQANLNESNLSGANLAGGVNLSGANLSKANLSAANMRQAKLMGADLSNANLSKVKLIDSRVEFALVRSLLPSNAIALASQPTYKLPLEKHYDPRNCNITNFF